MKLRAVTKLDKRNMATSKKFDVDTMGNLPPPQSQPLKSPLRLKLFYFNINIKL